MTVVDTLARPDVFRRMALLSVPFEGPPALPFATLGEAPAGSPAAPDIHDQLAALLRPRKDSLRHFASREANDDMLHCQQGLNNFFRASYPFKGPAWNQK